MRLGTGISADQDENYPFSPASGYDSCMRESRIEGKFRREVHKLGGLSYKLVPTTIGLPDRLVVLPGGRIVFVELKRAGGAPRPEQTALHRKLRSRGAEVVTLAGPEEVEIWLKQIR